MTNPQDVPGPGRDILTILLLALAAGVLLIAGLIVILISFAPEPEPWSAPEQQGPVDTGFDPTAPAAPPAPSDSVIDCGQPCFTLDDARTLVPTADQLALLGSPGLTTPTTDDGVVADWQAEANAAYYGGDGEPLQCSFAISPAPIVLHSQAYQTEADPVVVLGEWDTDSVHVSHVARLAESVMWGSRYPTLIRNAASGCPGYTLTVDGATRTTTLAPLDLDFAAPGVTEIAWTEEDGETVTTAADLQRGNIVMRIEVTRPAGSLTDEVVREYILDAAQRLASL